MAKAAYTLNARDALTLVKSGNHPLAIEHNATLDGKPVKLLSVWLTDPETKSAAWVPLFVHVDDEMYEKLEVLR